MKYDMTANHLIRKEINESIEVKQNMLESGSVIDTIEQIAQSMISTIRLGGKILLCGNGGSGSDALHFAAEIVGRFQKERKALPAIALNADIAILTSVSNDYTYEEVFARQVSALMTDKDTIIGLSTSGNSMNIKRAFETAHDIGGKTILFSGRSGGRLKEYADIALLIPSDVTAHIQEAHECVYHILCGMIEEELT